MQGRGEHFRNGERQNRRDINHQGKSHRARFPAGDKGQTDVMCTCTAYVALHTRLIPGPAGTPGNSHSPADTEAITDCRRDGGRPSVSALSAAASARGCQRRHTGLINLRLPFWCSARTSPTEARPKSGLCADRNQSPRLDWRIIMRKRQT